jgi:hypothetical protein
LFIPRDKIAPRGLTLPLGMNSCCKNLHQVQGRLQQRGLRQRRQVGHRGRHRLLLPLEAVTQIIAGRKVEECHGLYHGVKKVGATLQSRLPKCQLSKCQKTDNADFFDPILTALHRGY